MIMIEMKTIGAYLMITITLGVFSKLFAAEKYCETITIGFLPLKTMKSPTGGQTWPMEEIARINSNWRPITPEAVLEKYKQCYKPRYLNIHYPEEQWVYRDIVENKTLEDLSSVDVVVGHHIPSVERYCNETKVPYVLTLPPTIELEDRIIRHVRRRNRILFSAWPSWYNFFRYSIDALEVAIDRLTHDRGKGYRFRKTLGRLLILCEGPDTELTAIANKLAYTLQERVQFGIDSVAVRSYDTSNPLNYTNWELEKQRGTIDAMRDFDPDIVVYMYNPKNKFETLIQAVNWFNYQLSIMVSSERDTQWFLWDMRTDFSGILANLLNKEGYHLVNTLRLRTISLYSNKPFNITCDNITTDISELAGANDAIAMIFLNAATVSDMSFNKSSFLRAMRLKHTHLAGVSDRDGLKWNLAIQSGASFSRKGFRIFPAISIGTILPNASYSGRPGQKFELKSYYSQDDYPDVFTNCRPRLEYYISKYYEPGFDAELTSTEPVDSGVNRASTEDRIVVVEEEPIVFTPEKAESTTDDDFDGLAPDILREAFFRMSKKAGRIHKYKLYKEKNNQYGVLDRKTKKWTGVFGDIAEKKAVMAIGMISKTMDRKHDFEFSPAFEFVGITFLVKKSTKDPGWFAFMRPYKHHVWWGLLAVCLLSCLFIRVLDWWNPFMDAIAPEQRFTANESMWYSFGTITQAGAEFAPIMYPTRIYSVVYWFFALVVTACYTGNLASFLVERIMYVPIKNLNDIPLQRNFGWGTLNGSSMQDYLQHSSIEEEQHDHTVLSQSLGIVTNYKAGYEKARLGNYAFIGTNLLLQYYAAKDADCKLAVGNHMESFTEIAFPFSKDWHLKDEFSEAMYSMRHDGTIRNYIQRWITKRKCAEVEDDDEVHDIQLDYKNFKGLYVLLCVFICASYIVLFFKLGALKLKERHHQKQQREAETNTSRNGVRGDDIPMVKSPDATSTTV